MRFVDEDDAYDHSRQREIDDAAETERALFAGKEAGRMNAAAGTNKFHAVHERAQYDAWERGRSTIEAQRLAEELAKRPRTSCQPCTCGGRGMCLADAA